MPLENPTSGITLDAKDVEKFLEKNRLGKDMLQCEVSDWGLIRFGLVQGRQLTPIETVQDQQTRWKSSVPPDTEISPYSIKTSVEIFKFPKILGSRNLRTLGLCEMKDGIIDEKSFLRYDPMPTKNAAAIMTDMRTSKEGGFQKITYALVEMDEDLSALEQDLLRGIQNESRGQLHLPVVEPVLNPRKLREVRGVFEVGVESLKN